MQGIPVSDVFSTMKAFTGSIYVNDFNLFNRIYRVYIQADAPYRSNRNNLNLFFCAWLKRSDGANIFSWVLALYHRPRHNITFQYV